MDADLTRLFLEHRDDVVLRRETHAAGIPDTVLLAACRRGEAFRLTRGAYAGRAPSSEEDRRHLLSVAALRLYPDAQLSGLAAVEGWGVPVTGADGRRVDLARPLRHEVLTPELRIRPRRVDAPVSPRGPADPLPSALVQMTLDAGVLVAVPSLDAALHAGLVTDAALSAAAEEVAGWPRSSRVRCALAWADARSESLGESLTRVHLTASGIATTPQVLVVEPGGTVVARADLGVDGTRVLLEFDGKVKYSDGGADALFAEKQREDRMRRLGYVVVRVVWADLYRPRQLVARVREAMLTAAA